MRLLPDLVRAMARVSPTIQLDSDPHLRAALRQLLTGFLELPPAGVRDSTAEVAIRQALIRALLPINHPQAGAFPCWCAAK